MFSKNIKIKFSGSDLKKELVLPEILTPEFAEEIGLHIGDGTMNFYLNKKKIIGSYALRGHIVDDRRHYDSRINYLYRKVYNLKIPLRNMPSTGVCGFQIWSDALVSFKSKILNLPLGNKKSIFIPKNFFSNSDLLIPLLRGVYDTDGCLYLENKNKKLYPRVEFSTVSEVLSIQIEKSLLRCGFRATRYFSLRDNPNWNPLYKVVIRGDKMTNRFFDLIQPMNPKHLDKFNFYLGS